jgi:cutinase
MLIGRRRAGMCMAAIVSIFATLLCPVLPVASADPCPDIGVAFARGTGEPPGLGNIGQAFVDSLRAQAFPRTVGVHGVNYAASSNFAGGQEFTLNVLDGVRDVANHVQGVVSVCPATRMVLGGYSQGAIVAAFATSDVVPGDVPDDAKPAPMPAEIADHIAAVVLFGKPSGPSLVKYGAPSAGVGPLYAGKSLELCAPGDNVCSGDPVIVDSGAHGAYVMNGMTAQGAAFGVSRL